MSPTIPMLPRSISTTRPATPGSAPNPGSFTTRRRARVHARAGPAHPVRGVPNFTSDDATIQLTGSLSARRIDFVLTPTLASDVTVIAEVPLLDATDDVSSIELATEQVSVLPSLGERDLFRAFRLVPSVCGSNEASSGLYTRGRTPDQIRVEYDGFRVYHVDHLFGYFSAFNM